MLFRSGRSIEAYGASGFHVWIPVPDEGRCLRLLAEKGWAVAAGERFRIQSPRAIRVTTAALEPADAGRLAGDLAEALHPAAVRGIDRYHGAHLVSRLDEDLWAAWRLLHAAVFMLQHKPVLPDISRA
mgnify:CR=1 FL=1